MARRVQDRNLESRDARRKLPASGEPYWRAIDKGLHLGYRKGKTGGVWVRRKYLGGQTYQVESIGKADDNQDADGVGVLDFWQAQAKVRKKYCNVAILPTPSPRRLPLTSRCWKAEPHTMTPRSAWTRLSCLSLVSERWTILRRKRSASGIAKLRRRPHGAGPRQELSRHIEMQTSPILKCLDRGRRRPIAA